MFECSVYSPLVYMSVICFCVYNGTENERYMVHQYCKIYFNHNLYIMSQYIFCCCKLLRRLNFCLTLEDMEKHFRFLNREKK